MWLRVVFCLVLVAVGIPREAVAQHDSGCGTPKQQTGLSGTFSSMNYPNNYRDKARCTWIITVQPRWRIRIRFNGPFQFETHSSCGYDYVRLSEEVTSTTPIGTYCNGPPTADVMSQDNDMVVVFKSDGSNTGKGFSLRWTAVEPELSGCGSRYKQSGTSGSISSMNFPNNYQNDAECFWIITVPAGMRVRLFFEKKFEIEPSPLNNCNFDNVVVRQVDAAGVMGRSYGTFCGFSAPTNLLLSDDNDIAVDFNSDSTTTFPGFSIKWKAINGTCGTPESLLNGTVALSDEDKVSSKATYSCDVGFKLVGKNRQCLTSGRWAGEPPKCQEILCPPPLVPAQGAVSLTNGYNRVNSSATYTCNDGFQLRGGMARQCLISGRWSGETPSCQEIHCGTPGVPANGSMSLSDGDRMNSKATYSCDDDFLLHGDRVRECLHAWTWSGVTPTCQEIRCSSPELVANGSVAMSDEDKIGNKATYTCDGGFKLIGTSERRCLRTGNWSGDMPVCEEIRCGSPPLPVDGSVSLSNENKIGSKATYSCNDGFKLIGHPERQCLYTGNWGGETSTCEEIRCGFPSFPANGSVSLSDGDRMNSNATYICDDGFLLTGEGVRECHKKGNWSGDTPTCQEIHCGFPGTLANGNVSLSDEDRMNSKATYTCDDGFLLTGEGVRACQNTGNWSGDPPICQLQEIRCGYPEAPGNGSVSLSDEDRINSNASYMCDDGFDLSGECVSKCLSTGNWSRQTPTCQEIRCGFPGTPGNGSVSLSDEDRMNSRVTYTCDDGFLLIEDSVRECQKTGNWSGEASTCQEIRCGPPDKLESGRILLSNGDRLNSKARYVCNDGLVLSGDSERRCGQRGSWSGKTPLCKEIRCGPLEQPAHGRAFLSDQDKWNSQATYVCNDGYRMFGKAERLCLATWKWSGTAPNCQGTEDSRGGVSLPPKQNVVPASWSNIPNMYAYRCIGIVSNIIFLILVVCGTIYCVYRIMRRRGLQKRSSFNFDNPTFSGAKEQETQIA